LKISSHISTVSYPNRRHVGSSSKM